MVQLFNQQFDVVHITDRAHSVRSGAWDQENHAFAHPVAHSTFSK